MADTLGFEGSSEQNKLRLEVQKVEKAEILGVSLYGWGSNVFGQLAT